MMLKIKTVIIDDDPMVVKVIGDICNKAADFSVVGTAYDTSNGLTLIKDCMPELVLLDVCMPEIDGMEVLKTIRRDELSTDVIFITCIKSKSVIQKALRFGVVDYIIKPFSEERLLASLESYGRVLKRLKNIESFEQDELDELREYQLSSICLEQTEFPKGIHESSLNKITQFLTEQTEPIDVYEIARGLQMSAVTARRYLNYLKNNNVVNMDVKYSDIGRPRYVYAICRSEK